MREQPELTAVCRPHRARWLLNMTAFSSCLVASLAIGCRSEKAQNVGIVEPVPDSAHLLKHIQVRHGYDRSQLFVFSVDDMALCESLVKRWNLKDLTEKVEGPISFVTGDRPDWWPAIWPEDTRQYGQHSEKDERYWSVWEDSVGKRLYVEVGSW